MCDPCCGPCDPCYPCYPCRPCKSRELRGGNLIMSCECLKRNGLQHDCPRWECQAKPCCLTKPEATCCPSLWARRYRFVTMGRKSKFECPALQTVSTAGGGCNPCPVGPCSTPCDPCCLPAVSSPAQSYNPCCVPACDSSFPPVCKPICYPLCRAGRRMPTPCRYCAPCKAHCYNVDRCDPCTDCCVPYGPC